MTREDAKKWFENKPISDTETEAAYAFAIEALSQPKFVALREGEIAVLEIPRSVTVETAERIRDYWFRLTHTKCAILEGGARLAGKVSP